MSQHDMNIANQGFPAFRADLNDALGALATTSAGATEPSTTFANQFWYDSTDNLLKMRNTDNDAWITLAYFDQTNDEWEVRSAVIQAVDSAGVSIKTDDGTTRIEVQDDGDVAINTDTLFVDATNNFVGIGTTSPNAQLEIESADSSSNASLSIRGGSASAQSILFLGDGTNVNVQHIISDHGDNSLRFHTAASSLGTSERLRLTSNGQIYQNSAAPSTTSFGFSVARLGLDGLIESFRNTTGSGNSCIFGGSLGLVEIRGDGDLYNTNGTYGSLSDARLKENIVDANSQWNDIKALQFKNYNLIEYPDTTMLGVIAQDLEASGMSGLVKDSETIYWTEDDELPEGVSVGDVKEESRKTVKYSILYMKAVKALQEAMERIEALEARVQALES